MTNDLKPAVLIDVLRRNLVGLLNRNTELLNVALLALGHESLAHRASSDAYELLALEERAENMDRAVDGTVYLKTFEAVVARYEVVKARWANDRAELSAIVHAFEASAS